MLKEIVAFLKTYPNHPVLIEGHTDNDPIIGKLREKFQDNTALSQARCQAVKDYFVKTENLPEELFTAIGYGESRPLVPNDSRENKRINRRVLVIVKNKLSAFPDCRRNYEYLYSPYGCGNYLSLAVINGDCSIRTRRHNVGKGDILRFPC